MRKTKRMLVTGWRPPTTRDEKRAAKRTADTMSWLDGLIAQASTSVIKIDPETGSIVHDAPSEIYRRAAMPA